MKNVTLLVLSVIIGSFIAGCSRAHKGSEVRLGDTITTASGLKYLYVKQGTGRKVEPGSKVDTYLSLTVDGQVVWNTDELPDSIFTFVVGHDRMIKGFTEVMELLREGDEVVAVLPSDLAYGERGAGSAIPPNSTLVYDELDVLGVSEPRLVLSDTLLKALADGGMERLDLVYKQITTTEDSVKYHHEPTAWNAVWEKLMDAQAYDQALAELNYFSKVNKEIADFFYYRAMTYDSMGDFAKALDNLTAGAKIDTTWNSDPRFLAWRMQLEGKMKSAGKSPKK